MLFQRSDRHQTVRSVWILAQGSDSFDRHAWPSEGIASHAICIWLGMLAVLILPGQEILRNLVDEADDNLSASLLIGPPISSDLLGNRAVR